MQCFRNFPLRLALIALLGTLPSASWGLSLTEKANLQATMQRYIDQQTIDGVFLSSRRLTAFSSISKLEAARSAPCTP